MVTVVISEHFTELFAKRDTVIGDSIPGPDSITVIGSYNLT
jgi:hypothetical protein